LMAHNTSTLTSSNGIICQPGSAILGGVWAFKYNHASSKKKVNKGRTVSLRFAQPFTNPYSCRSVCFLEFLNYPNFVCI
jgi:hypothetical protein